MILEKTERFRATPKYLAVTQRLYHPYKELSNTVGLASTMADTERDGDLDFDQMVRGSLRHKNWMMSQQTGLSSAQTNNRKRNMNYISTPPIDRNQL